MAKIVRKIPATLKKETLVPFGNLQKRKVAAYARVSTDSLEQQTSYEAQVDYYTNYIRERTDWEFVGVYTDEGISATNTKKREGFKKMIEAALAGQIDLIVTKSVSRFARNTVDSLSTIRTLKEKGTEVYFEKENIWTFDSKGELLITIMSSLAQEESRSISENCTWGQRKRFADGKVSVPYSRFLGYDKGEDGNLVVNSEQAKLVRRIYGLFLQGHSPNAIARILTNEEVKTLSGKTTWYGGSIKSILSNEKYKGDALLQKTYITDFLSKKQKVNEGEIPQYYVSQNHEAIIPPDTFDRVQRQLAMRVGIQFNGSSSSPFSGKIKCSSCGGFYGSKVWHSNSPYRKRIWRCNQKFTCHCDTPKIEEEELKDAFVKAVNQLLKDKQAVLHRCQQLSNQVLDTGILEKEKLALEKELDELAECIQSCIEENAQVAQNQESYQERYNRLVRDFKEKEERISILDKKILTQQYKADELKAFLSSLEETDLVQEFDETMWRSLVEEVVIECNCDFIFNFRGDWSIRIF